MREAQESSKRSVLCIMHSNYESLRDNT